MEGNCILHHSQRTNLSLEDSDTVRTASRESPRSLGKDCDRVREELAIVLHSWPHDLLGFPFAHGAHPVAAGACEFTAICQEAPEHGRIQ